MLIYSTNNICSYSNIKSFLIAKKQIYKPPSIHKELDRLNNLGPHWACRSAPPRGLEPRTSSLTGRRSTNWATGERKNCKAIQRSTTFNPDLIGIITLGMSTNLHIIPALEAIFANGLQYSKWTRRKLFPTPPAIFPASERKFNCGIVFWTKIIRF